MYKKNGFTLIELLIAIGILSILTSIAMPSYQEYVRQSRRVNAQAALQAFAIAMERFRSEQIAPTYIGAAVSEERTGTPARSVFPSEAPLDGRKKFYDLKIYKASVSAYELRAVPKTETTQSGDKCGTFTLRSTGARFNLAENGSAIPGPGCWK